MFFFLTYFTLHNRLQFHPPHLNWLKCQTSQFKGNKFWIFIGRTDAEAEAPILWPPDAKSRLIRKDPDAGKGWGQEEKGVTEDEMVGWHHWLNGHEFEEPPGVRERQGNWAFCSWWDCKESDTTERLKNNYNTWRRILIFTEYTQNIHSSVSNTELVTRTHRNLYNSPKRRQISCF